MCVCIVQTYEYYSDCMRWCWKRFFLVYWSVHEWKTKPTNWKQNEFEQKKKQTNMFMTLNKKRFQDFLFETGKKSTQTVPKLDYSWRSGRTSIRISTFNEFPIRLSIVVNVFFPGSFNLINSFQFRRDLSSPPTFTTKYCISFLSKYHVIFQFDFIIYLQELLLMKIPLWYSFLPIAFQFHFKCFQNEIQWFCDSLELTQFNDALMCICLCDYK